MIATAFACSLVALILSFLAWGNSIRTVRITKGVATNVVRLGQATGDAVDELSAAVHIIDEALNELAPGTEGRGGTTKIDDIRAAVREVARAHAAAADAGES